MFEDEATPENTQRSVDLNSKLGDMTIGDFMALMQHILNSQRTVVKVDELMAHQGRVRALDKIASFNG